MPAMADAGGSLLDMSLMAAFASSYIWFLLAFKLSSLTGATGTAGCAGTAGWAGTAGCAATAGTTPGADAGIAGCAGTAALAGTAATAGTSTPSFVVTTVTSILVSSNAKSRTVSIFGP